MVWAEPGGGGLAPAGARAMAPAAVPSAGTFRALTPARLLDTRSGWGAPARPVAGNGSLVLQVTGRGGVAETGVSAVALNVTVTAPTTAGFLTVYPHNASRPTVSNLNFAPGQTVANSAVVPVAADGRVQLFNGSRATVQLVVDVAGYYTAGVPSVAGTFHPVAPTRLLDTRSGLDAVARPLAGSGVLVLQVLGRSGVPASGVSAVVLNVTATAPAAAGHLTVYPDGQARPTGSNLNFRAGQTVPNLVVVPVASDGRIQVFNGSGGTVHVLADVAGYYLAGVPTVKGAFQGLSPTRLLDTRSGLGAARSPVARNGALALQVTRAGAGGVLGGGMSAVALNVTVTNARGTGWMTAYPYGQRQPLASNLEFVPGQTVANLVVVPVGADGKVVFANDSSGAVDVIADVVGVFLDGNRTPVPQSCDNVPSDPSGTAVTRWNPITLCVLASLQQSAGNLDDVNIIILNESSGDPNAINLWDSNAAEGHPSEGLIQVIRPTFDQYRSAGLANNLYDPAANLYAGLNYAIHTYGSIHNVPGLVSLRNGGGYVGYIVGRR